MSRRHWQRPGSSPRASRAKAPRGLGLAVLAAGALALVVLPLIGLLQRAPWTTFGSDLTAHDALTALRLSVVTSLGALGLSVV